MSGVWLEIVAPETVGSVSFSKTFLMYEFPHQKKKIAALSMNEKMDWYAHQFQKNPGVVPVELTSKEFERFWKWHVLIPMKAKRLFYRIKNGQIFKKHPTITEIKAKKKG